MSIEYFLSLADPCAHEFGVRLRVSVPERTDLRLDLPAWIPGSYMIRDFARNVHDLSVHMQGDPMRVRKLDKQTWLIEKAQGDLEVRYRVYALDESVRSAYLDDTRAYFNGTSLFLRVAGFTDRPHALVIEPPGFTGSEEWRVATMLPTNQVDGRGFGAYIASDYAELIDHPVEIGEIQTTGFDIDGVHHQMVFVEAGSADIERIPRDLKPICQEHVAVFGELPVKAYQFQTLATRDGYGGLEHRDSTSLICKRADLPSPGEVAISKGYRQYLALCSHEYFHLWNVKRIRPEVLAEADLSREAHSELLWAFEGITSYYDELALACSGVLKHDDYLDMLAPSLTRYYRNPGRHRQSIAESSFDAWTKFYKQDESAPNAIVSYYNKGALVALGLDRLIRLGSDDRLCLDDLMRRLWQHFGATGRGIPERGIEIELSALLGNPVHDFFERFIYGVEELPLAEWLADFGVGLHLRSGQSIQDNGGYVSTPTGESSPARSLGARTSARDGLVRIDQVYRGGAAEQAGLTPGDLLLAVNGERCTPDTLDGLLARYPVGEGVRLSLFRRDLLREVGLEVAAAKEDTAELYWLPPDELSEHTLRRKAAWLASAARTSDD